MKHLPPDALTFDAGDIPAVLSRLRTLAGISQQEVAERMGSDHHNAYAQYETGKVHPSPEQLASIISALGYKLAFFAVKPPMDGAKLLKAATVHMERVGSKTILRKAETM